jgi:hypothetical protein
MCVANLRLAQIAISPIVFEFDFAVLGASFVEADSPDFF